MCECVCVYIYIYLSWDCSETERNSAMNYSRRYLDHENIGQLLLFFFFFPSISILSSRDVKLKNRTRNRNAWRSLKFSRIQACNYLLVTVEILEARNIGIRTGLRERHHCLVHAYSICIVSLINVRSKRNTVVSRSFIKFRYCTFVFLRFLPFNLPRII